jgi:hypothetical protein
MPRDWFYILPFLYCLTGVVFGLGAVIARRCGKPSLAELMVLTGLCVFFALLATNAFPPPHMGSVLACKHFLGEIAEAKRSWSLQTNSQTHSVPTEADLAPFLRGGVLPLCPTGGTYTLGAVNELPRCSHADKGHRLEPPAASPKSDGR